MRAVFFCTAILVLSCNGNTHPPADFILENGAIYTVDEDRTWAEAIAVSGGRILAVGAVSRVREHAGAETRIVDLRGKMVLPGFHDAHVHPVMGWIEKKQCDLYGLRAEAEVLARIRDFAAEHPHRPWIVGTGWELPVFPGANPRHESLDAVVPDRPAFLTSADGHSAWVNTRALEIAGVTRDTPDPDRGRIERDPGTGDPSGTLREAAQELVERYLPDPTEEEYLEAARAGVAMVNRFGITSIHDPRSEPGILAAYAALDRRNELTARVVVAHRVDPARDTGQIGELQELRRSAQGSYLRGGTVKVYADGVIESRTAALLEPYLDRAGYRGEPVWGESRLSRMVAALDRADFQIHIHAIGDRAIRMSLDALEDARRINGPRDARHLIAHLQLIDPEDIPRFRELGVVAAFQPFWAHADAYITDLTEPALGPERSRWLYPLGSVAATGAVLAGGSDWPVDSVNPLDAIQVAVTRRALQDTLGTAWIPEEIVDLPTMLAAYTINGAFANHQETETGSLEPGKAADFVVLDRNIFEVPPHEINSARVLVTVLEGREVYRGPGFSEFPPIRSPSRRLPPDSGGRDGRGNDGQDSILNPTGTEKPG